MARLTLAQRLEEHRVLIFNSSKPEVTPFLAQLGVDSAYLATGETLYNEVMNLFQNQTIEKQEERLAYDNYDQLKVDCKYVAKKNFKLIRLASRADSDLQNRLKIYVPRETTIEEWIKQTLEFYELVLIESEFLASISRLGITTESITKDKTDLESLKSLRNEAISEKGQAQEATRIRDEKMDQLDDYCYELETIATIALEGQPQLLEMLGILVRS